MVYDGVMGRTNIDIDDELIERVMRRYQLPSKRAARSSSPSAVWPASR